MRSLWAVVVAVCSIGVALALQNTTDNSCDFTHIDLDGAVDKRLAKFPEYHLAGSQSFVPLFAGIEIGGVNITGLTKLKRYGPLLPYCVNGTRMLQVDLISTCGVELSAPWRHCSGSEGNVTLRTALIRLTAQFGVTVSESSRDVVLSCQGSAVPVATEGLVLVLEGAGDLARQVAGGLSLAFRGVVQQLWAYMFYPQFDMVLRNALEDNTL